MIVQFKSVRKSIKESVEREELIEMGAKLDFYSTEDHLSDIFVEMDDVIDFAEGKVYYNDRLCECVHARLMDSHTTNLLLPSSQFKSILEYAKNIKIKTSEQILNMIKNENNSTGI